EGLVACRPARAAGGDYPWGDTRGHRLRAHSRSAVSGYWNDDTLSRAARLHDLDRRHRRGDLRVAGRLDAALRAPPAEVRPGECVSALRRHDRRRHGAGHLFPGGEADVDGDYPCLTFGRLS